MTTRPGRVVVLGSGAAGMAAAAGAAIQGAKVTLLEAAGTLGGTTATSGGGIWLPANPWSAAVGVSDSADDGLRYLRSLQHDGADSALPEAYVRDGVRVALQVEEHTPLRWQHLEGMLDYHPEHEGGNAEGRALEVRPLHTPNDLVERLRTNPYAWGPLTLNEEASEPPDAGELARREREGILTRGRALVAGLYMTVLEHGGEARTAARGTELMVSDGSVIGVRAGSQDFEGQVVVATGGFERNARFTSAFLRGPMLAPAGPPSNLGDGLMMGMKAGAALSNMSDAWWVAAIHVPGETIDGAPFYRMLFIDAAKPGGIVVDRNGRRFANEAACYYGFGRSLHELDANRLAHTRIPCWLIFDSIRRREHSIGPVEPGDRDPDWLTRADTLETLADRIEVTADELRGTVERFNAHAAAGQDPDFGRGSWLWDGFSAGKAPIRGVTEPPFYALRLLPGCSGTKGGLATDAHGGVLRWHDGETIPGLYAAGNASAYMVGAGYPGPGATIGPALVFGWRAGEAAAAAAQG